MHATADATGMLEDEEEKQHGMSKLSQTSSQRSRLGWLANKRIGRRTGKLIGAKRPIRKDAHGFEVFEDYFSSESDVSSFLSVSTVSPVKKTLGTDSQEDEDGKENKPATAVPRTQNEPENITSCSASQSMLPESQISKQNCSSRLGWLRNKKIGRRTGKLVTANKNIRKNEDGFEVFEDYFTPTSESSTSRSLWDLSSRSSAEPDAGSQATLTDSQDESAENNNEGSSTYVENTVKKRTTQNGKGDNVSSNVTCEEIIEVDSADSEDGKEKDKQNENKIAEHTNGDEILIDDDPDDAGSGDINNDKESDEDAGDEDMEEEHTSAEYDNCKESSEENNNVDEQSDIHTNLRKGDDAVGNKDTNIGSDSEAEEIACKHANGHENDIDDVSADDAAESEDKDNDIEQNGKAQNTADELVSGPENIEGGEDIENEDSGKESDEEVEDDMAGGLASDHEDEGSAAGFEDADEKEVLIESGEEVEVSDGDKVEEDQEELAEGGSHLSEKSDNVDETEDKSVVHVSKPVSSTQKVNNRSQKRDTVHMLSARRNSANTGKVQDKRDKANNLSAQKVNASSGRTFAKKTETICKEIDHKDDVKVVSDDDKLKGSKDGQSVDVPMKGINVAGNVMGSITKQDSSSQHSAVSFNRTRKRLSYSALDLSDASAKARKEKIELANADLNKTVENQEELKKTVKTKGEVHIIRATVSPKLVKVVNKPVESKTKTVCLQDEDQEDFLCLTAGAFHISQKLPHDNVDDDEDELSIVEDDKNFRSFTKKPNVGRKKNSQLAKSKKGEGEKVEKEKNEKSDKPVAKSKKPTKTQRRKSSSDLNDDKEEHLSIVSPKVQSEKLLKLKSEQIVDKSHLDDDNDTISEEKGAKNGKHKQLSLSFSNDDKTQKMRKQTIKTKRAAAARKNTNISSQSEDDVEVHRSLVTSAKSNKTKTKGRKIKEMKKMSVSLSNEDFTEQAVTEKPKNTKIAVVRKRKSTSTDSNADHNEDAELENSPKSVIKNKKEIVRRKQKSMPDNSNAGFENVETEVSSEKDDINNKKGTVGRKRKSTSTDSNAENEGSESDKDAVAQKQSKAKRKLKGRDVSRKSVGGSCLPSPDGQSHAVTSTPLVGISRRLPSNFGSGISFNVSRRATLLGNIGSGFVGNIIDVKGNAIQHDSASTVPLTPCITKPGASKRSRGRRVTICPEENVEHQISNNPSQQHNQTDDTPLPSVNSTPFHFAEVTGTVDTSTMEDVLKMRDDPLIVPEPAPSGVRRSQRTRLKPVAWYKNERVVFDHSNKSGPVILGVAPSLEVKWKKMERDKQMRRKLKAAIRKASLKDACRFPKKRLSVHMPLPDFVPHDNREIAVYNAFTQEEDAMECVMPYDAVEPVGPHHEAARSDDPYLISQLMNHPCLSAGHITIKPLGEKPEQLVSNTAVVFHVAHGKILAKIHRSTSLLQTGDSFCVPLGNTYSIKNLRSDAAILFYTIVKANDIREPDNVDIPV